MARKRNLKHQHIQIPSGTGRSRTISSPPTRGVNERLEQLRREQAPRATSQQREDVLSVATSRTIPQSLRQILQLPETAPPIPRRPRRVMGSRRIAGPPPPPSWLESSQHAPAHIREHVREQRRLWLEQSSLRRRPTKLNNLAQLEAGSQSLPKEGSLAHLALKSLAMNWDLLRDYEQYNVPTLPVRLKSCLLTYLALFGPEDAMDLPTLRWIFSEDLGRYNEDLIRLDLTGLFWEELTISDVSRFLSHPTSNRASFEKNFSTLQIKSESGSGPAGNLTKENSLPGSEHTSQQSDDEKVEATWEDEVDNGTAVLPLQVAAAMSFPNLTHLSLANAGNYASWAQLLEVSTHLAKVTHLSLANWPTPSMTPNSKTAFIHHRHRDIAVGGSHLYSAMDSDWHEAANILRRLSHKTYGLTWLDLEGCNEWLPALAWQETGANTRWTNRSPQFGQANFSTGPTDVETEAAFWEARRNSEYGHGPDWSGSWGQVIHVNVSQGIIPKDAASVRRLPSGIIACELLSYLRDLEDSNEGEEDSDMNSQVDDLDVHQWLEREKDARSVRSAVRQIRLNSRGPYCEFDHGWKAKAFLLPRAREVESI